jgi:hypothetical protein
MPVPGLSAEAEVAFQPLAAGCDGQVGGTPAAAGPMAVVRALAGPLQEAELDRCTQSVSYDKTILVGTGHTWRGADWPAAKRP